MSGALNSAAKAILALCPIVHNRPAPFKTPEEYLAYVEGQTDVKNAEVAPLDPCRIRTRPFRKNALTMSGDLEDTTHDQLAHAALCRRKRS